MRHAAPMSSFGDACRIEPVGPGRFGLALPRGWEQGPGVYGGVVLGAIANAAEAVAGPERPLRSVTAQIAAPVRAGVPSELEVEELRAGKRVTHLSVRIVQEAAVVCAALVVAGSDRSPAHDVDATEAPAVPAPEEVAPVVPTDAMPTFLQHVELRPCVGGYPGTRDRSGRSGGWVRLREPGPASAVALTLGLIDAYWPALLARSRTLAAMSSQTITAHLVGDLGALDPGAPALAVRETRAARGGYADETSWLWSGGRLVAVGHQLVVAI